MFVVIYKYNEQMFGKILNEKKVIIMKNQDVKDLYNVLSKYNGFEVNGVYCQKVILFNIIPNICKLGFETDFLNSIWLDECLKDSNTDLLTATNKVLDTGIREIKLFFRNKESITIRCWKRYVNRRIIVPNNFSFDIIVDERAFMWCRFDKQLNQYYIGIDTEHFDFPNNNYRQAFCKIDEFKEHYNKRVQPVIIVDSEGEYIGIYDITNKELLYHTKKLLKLSKDKQKVLHTWLNNAIDHIKHKF